MRRSQIVIHDIITVFARTAVLVSFFFAVISVFFFFYFFTFFVRFLALRLYSISSRLRAEAIHYLLSMCALEQVAAGGVWLPSFLHPFLLLGHHHY